MTNTPARPRERRPIRQGWNTALYRFPGRYPPKMLQEIMGHASITTTLDLYGHLYPGDMDRYADRLDSAADDAADDVSSSGTWAT